jgi:hypothetical protein
MDGLTAFISPFTVDECDAFVAETVRIAQLPAEEIGKASLDRQYLMVCTSMNNADSQCTTAEALEPWTPARLRSTYDGIFIALLESKVMESSGLRFLAKASTGEAPAASVT